MCYIYNMGTKKQDATLKVVRFLTFTYTLQHLLLERTVIIFTPVFLLGSKKTIQSASVMYIVQWILRIMKVLGQPIFFIIWRFSLLRGTNLLKSMQMVH